MRSKPYDLVLSVDCVAAQGEQAAAVRSIEDAEFEVEELVYRVYLTAALASAVIYTAAAVAPSPTAASNTHVPIDAVTCRLQTNQNDMSNVAMPIAAFAGPTDEPRVLRKPWVFDRKTQFGFFATNAFTSGTLRVQLILRGNKLYPA